MLASDCKEASASGPLPWLLVLMKWKSVFLCRACYCCFCGCCRLRWYCLRSYDVMFGPLLFVVGYYEWRWECLTIRIKNVSIPIICRFYFSATTWFSVDLSNYILVLHFEGVDQCNQLNKFSFTIYNTFAWSPSYLPGRTLLAINIGEICGWSYNLCSSLQGVTTIQS